jgi:hypothetical protein
MRVLVIWHIVSEENEDTETKYYALQDPREDELTLLYRVNGLYANSEATPEALEESLLMVASYTANEWLPGEIGEDDLPSSGGFNQVFSAGFIL